MSRIDRLREYRNMEGPCGASRNKSDLNYWSNRASAHSEQGKRAKGGPVKLYDTGGQPTLHDTAAKHVPADPYPKARSDLNHADSSSFMRDVRRSGT